MSTQTLLRLRRVEVGRVRSKPSARDPVRRPAYACAACAAVFLAGLAAQPLPAAQAPGPQSSVQPARAIEQMTPVRQTAPASRSPAALPVQQTAPPLQGTARPPANAAPPTAQRSAPAAVRSGSAAVALTLARAIDLYALNDDGATAQFEEVLRLSPQEPGALWYLGLLRLDEGLRLRREAEQEQNETQKASLLDAGRLAFEAARGYLDMLLKLDQAAPSYEQVRPIEAGLVLAIARLAEGDKDKFLQLTRQAIATLEDYDRQIQERGAPDHLASFFLGIAHWRLGIYLDDPAAKARAAEYFDQTERLIGPMPAASAPASANEALRAQELIAIRLYVRYYRGIQALDSNERARGIELLREVETDAGAFPELGPLRADAIALIEAAQRTDDGPRPISFFERPVGPIEFRGAIQLGMGYDSNVILQGDDTALPRRIPHQDDVFAELLTSFELTRRFSREEDKFAYGESFTLGISADLAHRWHPSVGEFDLNQYRARTFLAWEPVTDFFAYFEYLYSYTMLGHDPFISGNSGFIGLTKRWSNRERESYGTRSDIYYGYEWRNYLDQFPDFRLDRDGDYQLIGLRQSFDLWRADEIWPKYYADAPEKEQRLDAKRFMNVFAGYEFREERTQGSEFDLGGHSILGGVDVPLPWRLSAGYQFRFNWENYAASSVFDFTGDERFDFRQVHGFVVTYLILGRGERQDFQSLEIRLRGFAELLFQDSNVTDSRSQDVYSYDRGQYGVALQIGF